MKAKRGRGRPELPDEFLSAVATDYVHALVNDLPPVRYVADMRRAPIEKARNWIRQARLKRFLIGGAPGKGKKGGRLSAKAKNVSRKKEDQR
jgi:hypothetical protein